MPRRRASPKPTVQPETSQRPRFRSRPCPTRPDPGPHQRQPPPSRMARYSPRPPRLRLPKRLRQATRLLPQCPKQWNRATQPGRTARAVPQRWSFSGSSWLSWPGSWCFGSGCLPEPSRSAPESIPPRRNRPPALLRNRGRGIRTRRVVCSTPRVFRRARARSCRTGRPTPSGAWPRKPG